MTQRFETATDDGAQSRSLLQAASNSRQVSFAALLRLGFVLALGATTTACETSPTTSRKPDPSKLAAAKPEAPNAAASPTNADPIVLPTARNGIDSSTDCPRISVDHKTIRVDDELVGDVAPIVGAGKPTRIDDEFTVLKRIHVSWKSAHPGEPSSGLVLFDFDRATPAAVVKSVVYTAGFAAFPNAKLEVRTPSGGRAQFWVDPVIPRPDGSTASIESKVPFRVVVTPTRFSVAWHDDKGIERLGPASLTDLADGARKLWVTHGLHRVASDRQLDAVAIFVTNDVSYERLVSVLDAISETQRPLASSQGVIRWPALEPILCINDSPVSE